MDSQYLARWSHTQLDGGSTDFDTGGEKWRWAVQWLKVYRKVSWLVVWLWDYIPIIVVNHWLVVWTMTFVFPIILGMSSSQLNWLTHIFQRGEKTTNQIRLLLCWRVLRWFDDFNLFLTHTHSLSSSLIKLNLKEAVCSIQAVMCSGDKIHLSPRQCWRFLRMRQLNFPKSNDLILDHI